MPGSSTAKGVAASTVVVRQPTPVDAAQRPRSETTARKRWRVACGLHFENGDSRIPQPMKQAACQRGRLQDGQGVVDFCASVPWSMQLMGAVNC